MDIAAMYRDGHIRVSDRVARLTPGEIAATVPGTPLWSIAELVAHVVGVASDILYGRLAGIGTPEWTASQVALRAGRPIAALLDEWRDCAEKLDPVHDEGLVRDLLIHEADLAGALAVADALPPESVAWVVDFALGDLGGRIEGAGLAGLRVITDDEERCVGTTPPGPAITTTTWELFRSLCGRRSAAQVRRYDWQGDLDPYIAIWNRHGPLPDHDVRETGSV